MVFRSAMPSSDWYSKNAHWIILLFYLLLVSPVVFWIGSRFGYDEAHSNLAYLQVRAAAETQTYSDCLRRSSESDITQCIREKAKLSRDIERAEEDLQAQQRMANWALGTLLVGGVSVVFGFVGLLFVVQTFRETKEATEIAERQLAASERPWLEITSVSLAGPLFFDPSPNGSGHVEINVGLKNWGKSPAVRIYADTRIILRNTQSSLHAQKIFSEALRKTLTDTKRAPDAQYPEFTLYPTREEKFGIVAWVNAEDLQHYRSWAENASATPIALVGLVGSVFYESPITEGLHQTSIIRDLVYLGTNKIRGFEGALNLSGSFHPSELRIDLSAIGRGPVD